jgi:hypothetical protein
MDFSFVGESKLRGMDMDDDDDYGILVWEWKRLVQFHTIRFSCIT